jgi:hypothetical protein
MSETVPLDDPGILPTPDLQLCGSTGGNVHQNVDTLVVVFGLLQVVSQPLQLPERIEVFDEQPKIESVPWVSVKPHDSKSWARTDGVVPSFQDSLCNILPYHVGPHIGHQLKEPFHTELSLALSRPSRILQISPLPILIGTELLVQRVGLVVAKNGENWDTECFLQIRKRFHNNL